MTNKELKEILEKRVGFLRQWLNEERIKDGEKFVTNQDLLHWLLIEWEKK